MKHLMRRGVVATAALLALMVGAIPASATAAPGAGAAEPAPLGVLTQGEVSAAAPAGPYHLVIQHHGGKCLNLPGASPSDNVRVEQWTCGPVVSERWYFDWLPSGREFRIRSAASGKCLNFQGAVYTNYTAIIQSGCGDYPHGVFSAPCRNNPCTVFWIKGAYAPGSSGCVHQLGGVPDNGGRITAWQCAIGYSNMLFARSPS